MLAISGLIGIAFNLSFDGFIQREILHFESRRATVLIENRMKFSLLLGLAAIFGMWLFSGSWWFATPVLGAVAISLAVTAQGALRSSGDIPLFVQFGTITNIVLPSALFVLAGEFRDLSPSVLFAAYVSAITVISFIFLAKLKRNFDVRHGENVAISPFVIEGLAILPHTLGLYILLYSDRLGLTFLGEPEKVTEIARAALPASALFALMSVFVGPFTKQQFTPEHIFKDKQKVSRMLVVVSAVGLVLLVGIQVLITFFGYSVTIITGLEVEYLALSACYVAIPLASLSYAIVGGQLFMRRDGGWYSPFSITIGAISIATSTLIFKNIGGSVYIFPLFICLGYCLLSLVTLIRAQRKWRFKSSGMYFILGVLCSAQLFFTLN